MTRPRLPTTGVRSSSSPPNLEANRRLSGSGGVSHCSPGSKIRGAPGKEEHDRNSLVAGYPLHRSITGDERGSPALRHKAETSSEASRDTPVQREPLILEVAVAESRSLDREPSPGDGDFLEGGIELSPCKESAEGGFGETEDVPARCLMSLDDEELQAVWPLGTGPKALFLDYDGTLREFEARPEMATPTDELIDILTQLDSREDLVPHIISGRDAVFLETHFSRFTRFTLIAEHGFQISPPGPERSWQLWEQYGGNVRYFKDHENWKSIMRAEIERLVQATPGSHLEEKQSSLVWHYREVANEAQGEAAAVRAVSSLDFLREKENITDVKISHGHKVVEVSYRNVRKGLVMRRLCEEKALFGEPFDAVLAVGDDISDETMFNAAPRDFFTIKVGAGATLARFRVETPKKLREFLRERLLRDS